MCLAGCFPSYLPSQGKVICNFPHEIMKYLTVFLKRNCLGFSMGLFLTCLCAVCRRMGAAMSGLSWLNLAVLHWVVPCFLICLFFPKLEGSFSPVFKAVVYSVSLVRKHVNWVPVIRCWSTHPKKERKKEKNLSGYCSCVQRVSCFPYTSVCCWPFQCLKMFGAIFCRPWNGLVCWCFVLYQLHTLVLDTSEY